jgi:hypothetical protein
MRTITATTETPLNGEMPTNAVRSAIRVKALPTRSVPQSYFFKLFLLQHYLQEPMFNRMLLKNNPVI